MSRAGFILFLLVDAAILLGVIPELSISGAEAKLFFSGDMFVARLIRLSVQIFGQNDYALRLPFLVLHLVNLLLLAAVAAPRLKRPNDLLPVLVVYALLPGVNSAALLVSKAGFVIFGTLGFIVLYERWKMAALLFLSGLTLVDNAFAFLFLGLIFFSMQEDDKPLLTLSILLFGVSMTLFGFDTGGKPRSYLADTMGVFATIFSPFVFLFFIYTLYRLAVRETRRDILWYLGATAFLLALLLSFRQRVAIEDLAPFTVVTVPLMIRTFYTSYRSRLPRFRRAQAAAAAVTLGVLAATSLISLVNKPLYRFLARPSDHFAYNFHIARDLAAQLRARKVTAVTCNDPRLAQRLKFYGIQPGGGWSLGTTPVKNGKKVSIVYTGKEIGAYYVTKVNN